MNPQELKAQCEKLWHGRELLANANRVEFFEIAGKLSWKDGAAVNPTIGKSAAAFIRKCTKHYGAPALPANADLGKLKPPKWLVENYKRNCPRNWKALVEGYGETRTKYDAPLPGERSYKDKWRWSGSAPECDHLFNWQRQYRTQRRLERAKERRAMHLARSPEMIVQRLYGQLRDLFGESIVA